MMPGDWPLLLHFKPAEFPAPEKMGYQHMLRLDRMRREAGVPCKVSSSFRTRKHNKAVGGAADSAHCDGDVDGELCEATDIMPLDSHGRFEIVRAAFLVGFERIGIYENGSIHVDSTGEPHGHRPNRVLWHVVSNPA